MPTDVKTMFDKKYPKLIENISPYVVVKTTIPSTDNSDDICEWWEY